MTTITPFQSAVDLYMDVARLRGPADGRAVGPQTPTGPSFSQALQNAAASAVETLQKSEQVSQQAVTGQVDLRDVVLAVNNAEIALQTVIAVRDKVILAYQEIMRMPI